MYENAIVKIPAVRYKGGSIEEIEEPVVVEDKITLHLNGRKYLTMVATNESLTELGAGFFVAAGIAKQILSVDVDGADVFVEADGVRCVDGALESSGGFAPEKAARVSAPDARITPDEIFAIREALNGDAWGETGGLHCTVLYHNHQQAAVFSDIGRHNTVDKAIGYMILNGLNPAECVIGCTGRQPIGMVSKAANAGIPIIVSRAASTSAGIAAAVESGVTLICFTRDRRFTVYAHPQRIEGL
ncbi:MAG: formate dehydrogenase accessory sulfurtransferase FdhD [Methanocorpusculum sp.]|nr:formate dehydrogenase accessory sulfurtransferase FdhD [Methanocorpusculum sp.]